MVCTESVLYRYGSTPIQHVFVELETALLKTGKCTHSLHSLKFEFLTLRLCVNLLQQHRFGVLDVRMFFLAHSEHWKGVEQLVEPVVCRVVDVRVLTQVMTQLHHVGSIVVVEDGRTVQRHQNNQAITMML